MIIKNKDQLKSLIKKMAKEKQVFENVLLQNYMMERLLERISKSKYKDNFILKGGMLISSLVGISSRSTMDIDTTIRKMYLEKELIINVIKEIISINVNDDILIDFVDIKEIREEDQYNGYKVSLISIFDTIRVPIKIDITAGDLIFPSEINYEFKLTFENKSINILAYNLETIISEKLETIIKRNIYNTRARDFYDIYTLLNQYKTYIDFNDLRISVYKKFESRNSLEEYNNMKNIIKEISESKRMKQLWENYRSNYSFAKDLEFENIIEILMFLFDQLVV